MSASRGPPAFPSKFGDAPGMTLREYTAIALAAGAMANMNLITPQGIVKLTDALLAELSK